MKENMDTSWAYRKTAPEEENVTWKKNTRLLNNKYSSLDTDKLIRHFN